MRRRVRILCYHGFGDGDEIDFRTKLFVSSATFARRLDFLVRSGFEVVTLSSAVAALRSGNVTRDQVVITIDDGFASTHQLAMPLLLRYKLPATVYVTTYFVVNRYPIISLTIQYLFYKSNRRTLALANVLGAGLPEEVVIRSEEDGQAAMTMIAKHIALMPLASQYAALKRLAVEMEVPFQNIERDDGPFHLMSQGMITEWISAGLEIQLHTHRHRFAGESTESINREISENRKILAPMSPAPLVHFCYPSGQYEEKQLPHFEQLGIESAVTCGRGLASESQNLLELPRFLDGEMVWQIEFEAEMAGFMEVVRSCSALIRRRRGSK